MEGINASWNTSGITIKYLLFGVCIASVALSRVWVWRWRLQQHGTLTTTSQTTLMLTSIQDAMDATSDSDDDCV